MRLFLANYKYPLLLVLIGIAWILFLNELLQATNQNVIYPDSDNYRESADFFYHHFKAHYYRPLGMAMLFGIPYLFGGNDASIYSFSLVINIAAWLGTALLVFSFLKKYLVAGKAFIFALLFYSLLGVAFSVFHLLTENIFIFFILLSFYFIDKYYTKASFYYLSLALGLLLFTILIRPGIKFLVIVLILYYSRAIVKNYYRRSALFMYAALALIVFQCIKMKQEYGNFTITYVDGVTLYNYLGSKAMCLKTNTEYDQSNNKRADYIYSLSYSESKEVASKDFILQAKTNTINLVKAYFIDIAINCKSPSDCINLCKNINGTRYFEPVKNAMVIISKYQNRLLSVIGFILAGLCLARSYKKPDVLTLLSTYVLYIITVSGISSYQGDRFHIVIFPVVIILLGKLYAEKYNKLALSKL